MRPSYNTSVQEHSTCHQWLLAEYDKTILAHAITACSGRVEGGGSTATLINLGSRCGCQIQTLAAGFWAGLQGRSGRFREKKIFFPYRESNDDSSII